MRGALGLLVVAALGSGCQTHLCLRDNTLEASATLTDLTYQQILNNVALFAANSSSLPSLALVNAGTVTVADNQTVSGNATYSPTVAFAQQAGGTLPILTLLASPGGSRTLTENWSLAPITDVDSLRRIRCAYQFLIRGGTTPDCDDCLGLLREFYPREADQWECLIPRGWFGIGCKKDVPREACYVGCYRDTYVWVLPHGVEGLTRFSMTVLDLATGKPHAPTKTVVRTFKADGTLDQTEVTTTEIDNAALERMIKEPIPRDRPRRVETGGQFNPGLFFVPGK